MHLQIVLHTVPEAREESDHDVCPLPKVVTSNVQNTTTEVKAFFICLFIIETSLHTLFLLQLFELCKMQPPCILMCTTSQADVKNCLKLMYR